MTAATARTGTSASMRSARTAVAIRVAGTGGAAAVLALAYAALPGHSLVFCPFRAITGVPCPVCGGTTAALAVAHLDLRAACAASPLVVIGAALFVIAPVLASSVQWRPPPRFARAVLMGALILSEGWQLVRLGVLA